MAANSQTPGLNREKYDIYRGRLLDGFMVSSPGNEPGTNIPASVRNIYNRQMRWGDATINLSNYMAVLATEYALQKREGEPAGQTLKELHFALLAMERLDAGAGTFYGDSSIRYAPDGFFKRDDVPDTFTRDWVWKNPAFKEYPLVRSDFADQNIYLNEMSQDQVWNLIIGLSLISHLVDDTSYYNIPEYYGHNAYTLSQRSMMAAFRIIRAMQARKCFRLPLIGRNEVCLQYWHLRNPFTGRAVMRGSNPNFLKYGFAESGNYITGYAFGDMHWGNSASGAIWYNLSAIGQYLQRFVPGGHLEYMYYMGTTATVGNIWSTRRLVRLFNRHMEFPFTDYPQYEHLALISCVLHGDCPKILDKERARYENLLNIAPVSGPLNYGSSPGYTMVYEWSSINRFVWPHRRGTGTSVFLQGEYNGLDYLLLYNLYKLVYGDSY